MGMAASQARFLGLTARKNNVEFEGQQINQQRTALSNQSANYYNDLLGMAVPIPPSVDDYTKTVYTFEDGALTNQITAMIAQPNGDYTISYLRQWVDDFSAVSAHTSIVNKSEDPMFGTDVYRVGAKQLRPLTEIPMSFTKECTEEEIENLKYVYVNTDDDGNVEVKEVKLEGGAYYILDEDGNPTSETVDAGDVVMCLLKSGSSLTANDIILVVQDDEGKYYKDTFIEDDEYLSTLSKDQLDKLLVEEAEFINLLEEKYGPGPYMVRYIQNTTTGEYEPYFYKLSDLESENTMYDDNGNSQSNIRCYKIGSETKVEEVKALPGCKVEKDSSGRYINVTIPQYKDGQIEAGAPPVTYALTTSTVTDQDAYQDAMNQYEFEKYQYDQTIQEINAKIEIIQAEDKNLELRLKQLDTEQKAISTEIDAVSQVIQKNTESSFKTFG